MAGPTFMGWGLGMLGMLAFWGLLVAGAVLLIRHWTSGAPRAEQVLAQRLARGEIGPDEYRERLTALRPAHDEPTRYG